MFKSDFFSLTVALTSVTYRGEQCQEIFTIKAPLQRRFLSRNSMQFLSRRRWNFKIVRVNQLKFQCNFNAIYRHNLRCKSRNMRSSLAFEKTASFYLRTTSALTYKKWGFPMFSLSFFILFLFLLFFPFLICFR